MPLEHIKDMFAGTPYSGFIPGRMGTGLSGQYSVLGMLLHPSVAAGYQGLVDHWLNGTRSAVEKDRLCRAEHFVEQVRHVGTACGCAQRSAIMSFLRDLTFLPDRSSM
jgi:hypothetical protein